jgi:hypothetical protein
MGYEFAENLIISCFRNRPEDEQKRLVVEILEGRKILKGSDKITLEDDNRDVHHLSEMILRLEKKIKKYEQVMDEEGIEYQYIDLEE